jgi:hypothetical protein
MCSWENAMSSLQGDFALHLAKEGDKFFFFNLHRQFLPANHEFRNDPNGFRVGVVVNSDSPPQLIGQHVLH